MPTPAYTPLDRNKPDGSVGTGTTFAADLLAELRALADSIVLGRSHGWTQARSGGTAAQPQYITYTNGTLRLRVEITWTGYNPTTLHYEWSNDSGATWADVGSSSVLTFDGSQNVTASTNSAGLNTWIMEIWAKTLKAVDDLAAHIGLTGTAAHGLGTISTQDADAVDISDGVVDAALGSRTPMNVDATRVREDFHDYGLFGNAATATIEVDKYAHVSITPSATTSHTIVLAFSGWGAAGKSQTVEVELHNARRSADGKISFPAGTHWVGGSGTRPLDTALEVAGDNLYTVTSRDGGTTCDWTHHGKRG